MSFNSTIIIKPIDKFLQIAELDRRVWVNSADAQFVPDGEHSWRVWTEHSFVCASVTTDGAVIGALCAFDTSNPELHFAHKIFIDEEYTRKGIGLQLLGAYCEYLDTVGKASAMTVSPENTASINLGNKYGFVTESMARGYYRPAEDRLIRVRPRKVI